MNPINSSGVLPFGDVTNRLRTSHERKPSLKKREALEVEALKAAKRKEKEAAKAVKSELKAAQASLGLSQAPNDKESNGNKRPAEVETQQLSPQPSKRLAMEEVREFWQLSAALLNGSDTGLETLPVLPGTPSLKNAELTGHLTALLKQYEKKLGEKSPLPPLFSELKKPACTADIFSPDKTDFPFDVLENVENLGGLGFYELSPSTFNGIVKHYADNLENSPHSANSPLGRSSDNDNSKAKACISTRF